MMYCFKIMFHSYIEKSTEVSIFTEKFLTSTDHKKHSLGLHFDEKHTFFFVIIIVVVFVFSFFFVVFIFVVFSFSNIVLFGSFSRGPLRGGIFRCLKRVILAESRALHDLLVTERSILTLR